jgi:hypothetical protein
VRKASTCLAFWVDFVLRILRSHDHTVVPWRNGGGVTREVALQNAPDGDFLWRVSIATVGQSGPFSRFHGIDRTIVVLAGAGFRLRVDDQNVDLCSTDPPFSFSGEAEVMAEVSAGDTLDLNVMTRRGLFSHSVQRLHISKCTKLALPEAVHLLIANGSCRLQLPDADVLLGKLDGVLMDGLHPYVELEPHPHCELFAIQIHRC